MPKQGILKNKIRKARRGLALCERIRLVYRFTTSVAPRPSICPSHAFDFMETWNQAETYKLVETHRWTRVTRGENVRFNNKKTKNENVKSRLSCISSSKVDRSISNRVQNYQQHYTVWVKNSPPLGDLTSYHFFHKRLRICNRFFTHLLNVPILARLQIYIQLSPILTKLCHIKRDYPVHIICAKCPKRAKTRAFRRLRKSLIALLIVVCGKSL